MAKQILWIPLLIALALIIVVGVYGSIGNFFNRMQGATDVGEGTHTIYGQADINAEARLGSNIVIENFEYSVDTPLFAIKTFSFWNPVENMKCQATFINGQTGAQTPTALKSFGDVGARFGEEHIWYRFSFYDVPKGYHQIKVRCISDNPVDQAEEKYDIIV